MVDLLQDTTTEAPFVGRGAQIKKREVRNLNPPCTLLGPHLPTRGPEGPGPEKGGPLLSGLPSFHTPAPLFCSVHPGIFYQAEPHPPWT